MIKEIKNNLVLFRSTKNDGNMSIKFSNHDDALTNKKKFFESINIDISKTLLINIKYKDNIFTLNDSFIKEHPDMSKTIVKNLSLMCAIV